MGRRLTDATRLSLQRKNLIADWDTEKNTKSPHEFSYASNVKVYWCCQKCSHRWLAAINNRSAGRGCPACGKRTVSDQNRLTLMRPNLAAEWDAERNVKSAADVSYKSHLLAHWCCAVCSHRWQSRVGSRSGGYEVGCPACSGRVVTDSNRLSLLKPELVADWDNEKNLGTPADFAVFSNTIVHWKCRECDCCWSSTVNNRSHGNGCPGCAAKRRFCGTSLVEVAIAAELVHVFSLDDVDSTRTTMPVATANSSADVIDARYGTNFARTKLRPDIVLPGIFEDSTCAFVVEWDGSFWHNDEAHKNRDRAKTEHLTALGHVVVRLREAPLEALTPHCVLVAATVHNSDVRVKAAVDAALRHLQERHGDEMSQPRLTKRARRSIVEYLASTHTQNQAAAAQYWKDSAPTSSTQATLDTFLVQTPVVDSSSSSSSSSGALTTLF